MFSSSKNECRADPERNREKTLVLLKFNAMCDI